MYINLFIIQFWHHFFRWNHLNEKKYCKQLLNSLVTFYHLNGGNNDQLLNPYIDIQILLFSAKPHFCIKGYYQLINI